MRVNIRDIASLADVSTATVSRVLNNSPLVNDDTKKRVQRIIAENGYVRVTPKIKQNQKNVCIIIPSDTRRSEHIYPTNYTILNGIVKRLSELGVSNCLFMPDAAENGIDVLLSLKADGYIMLRTNRIQEDEIIPRLLENKQGKPILMVNRCIDRMELSYVSIDDHAAEFCATEHLIKNGCRRIAFVNGDELQRDSLMRRQGFLDAMKINGLNVNPQLMLAGKYSSDFGREAVKALLGLPRELQPDGIVSASDIIALGIEKELLHRGISIPNDMQLIGFDDVESAIYISPPLSTMSIPAKDMGIQAANAIDHLMSSSSIQTIKVQMRSELIVRSTTFSCRTDRA